MEAAGVEPRERPHHQRFGRNRIAQVGQNRSNRRIEVHNRYTSSVGSTPFGLSTPPIKSATATPRIPSRRCVYYVRFTGAQLPAGAEKGMAVQGAHLSWCNSHEPRSPELRQTTDLPTHSCRRLRDPVPCVPPMIATVWMLRRPPEKVWLRCSPTSTFSACARPHSVGLRR